jgi:MFS-type transporter involved in bile tolerance (Atg22 family)
LPLLVAGWTLHTLVFVALAWIGEVSLLWGIAGLLGLYMAATEGVERALIADLVAPGGLGSAYGWYYLTKGLLLLPASAAFGWIWQVADARTAFAIAAVLAALGTLLLSVWVAPAVRSSH